MVGDSSVIFLLHYLAQLAELFMGDRPANEPWLHSEN